MPLFIDERYPVQYEERLILKNGKSVFIRPLLPSDEDLILDLFGRLGRDSVYLRFLTHLKSLPEDLLFQLIHINYSEQFALVALIREDGKDALIAVARYVYEPEKKTTDIAIVVRDDWQHCGLGKTLLRKMFFIGREHGVTHFSSMIDPENRVMKHLLLTLVHPVKYSYVKGYTQVEIFV